MSERTSEGGNFELNRIPEQPVGTPETRFPWLQWQFRVGAWQPEGSVAHAYRIPRGHETLCGAQPNIEGARVYPRGHEESGVTHVHDTYCPDCLAEAEARWGEQAEPAPTSPERRHPSPRIYVASLADYNNGELLGAWLDADQEPEALQAEIEAMLARSTQEVAEEWAIHDYEGFGLFRVHEYESLASVSAVARGIAEHGQAFAAYVSWAGTSEEALDAFDGIYMGHWPSLEAYARELAEDFGWEAKLRELPEDMQHYVAIDYDGLARLADTTMNIVDGEDGIYVFSEH